MGFSNILRLGRNPNSDFDTTTLANQLNQPTTTPGEVSPLSSQPQRLEHPGSSWFTSKPIAAPTLAPAPIPSLPTATPTSSPKTQSATTPSDPLLDPAGGLPPEAKAEALRLYRDRIRRANELEEIQHKEIKRKAIRDSRANRDSDRDTDASKVRDRLAKIRAAKTTTPESTSTGKGTMTVNGIDYTDPVAAAHASLQAAPPAPETAQRTGSYSDLQRLVESYRGSGMTLEEATLSARRQLGWPTPRLGVPYTIQRGDNPGSVMDFEQRQAYDRLRGP